MESYGVVWQENGAEPVAGKLEIDLERLRFEGNDRDHLIARSFALSDLFGVQIGRESCDRLDGHPTLLLELASGDRIRVAALTQAGIVPEIAERLAKVSTVVR